MPSSSSSRDAILASIRQNQPTETKLHPGLFAEGIRYENPEQQFLETLAAVGGGGHVMASPMEAAQFVLTAPYAVEIRKAVCLSPELLPFTREAAPDATWVDLNTIDDPHQLDDIDLAIVPGELAVAENAAVWVGLPLGKYRSVIFLAQHLILTVPRSRLVHNLHEAYAQIDVSSQEYGLWVSGPSKTADIEQSLVIGAHGPRSQRVLLLG